MPLRLYKQLNNEKKNHLELLSLEKEKIKKMRGEQRCSLSLIAL